MNDAVRVLIVEDDPQIRNFISYAARAEGFQPTEVGSGQEALDQFQSGSCDIMILDLGLPDMDGKKLISRIRETSLMPIIVVSARDREDEKVEALDRGADDYLTKPFSTSELMARLRVACRHMTTQNGAFAGKVMTIRGLTIDFGKHLVYLNGSELHLTPMEYKLLSLLFRNAGKVLTTSTIIDEVWGPGYGSDTQALRAMMAGLRRKIEKNPAKPQYIITEIGVGYRLRDE